MIGVKTSHCAPFLQRLLTGEGLKSDVTDNMQSHLSSAMLDLIDKEQKKFDSITTRTDDQGRGFTTVGPGTVIH